MRDPLFQSPGILIELQEKAFLGLSHRWRKMYMMVDLERAALVFHEALDHTTEAYLALEEA